MFKKLSLTLGIVMFLSFGVWGFVSQPGESNALNKSGEFLPTPTPKVSPTVSPTESPSPMPSPTDMPMPSPTPSPTPKS